MVDSDTQRDWHRLFGMLLTDFFTGWPFAVDVERDLSQQQQLLDVLIVRRGRGRQPGRLPDGLAPLAAHNLITFKSHRETLDAYAMKELLQHFVAYHKLASPSPKELLPEEQFRLYAICARFPHKLAQQVPWQEQQPGVYDCTWATDTVRVIVAGELPREEQNAPLHLFSASVELVGYGRDAYRQRSERTSHLLRQLLERYRGEASMSFTVEDFDRWYFMDHFAKLTPQEQREALGKLTPQRRKEVLQSLPPEERLAGIPPEEPRGHSARGRLAGIPPEDRLAGIPPEEIRRYLDRVSKPTPPLPRKRRRKT